MDRRIELIGSGEDVGIKDNNKLDFYPREDLSVSSTEESVIVIKDTRNGVEVLRANTTDFISPEEASVKDLIILVKGIIDTVTVLELSVHEIQAIQNANNPSISNVFVTFLDVFSGAGTKGLVPDPITSTGLFLKDDGTWGAPPPLFSLRNISSTDTFGPANETINCTSGTFTVNLPTAVGIQGTTYTLVNSGTGVITLNPNGSETINGSLTIDIKKQYVSRTVQSDGSNWIII
jgi:hypothetical protein